MQPLRRQSPLELVDILLTVGSHLPVVGGVCEAAKGVLAKVQEYSNKLSDVQVCLFGPPDPTHNSKAKSQATRPAVNPNRTIAGGGPAHCRRA